MSLVITKEEGRRKKEEGRGKKEEGRGKKEEGRRKKIFFLSSNYQSILKSFFLPTLPFGNPCGERERLRRTCSSANAPLRVLRLRGSFKKKDSSPIL